MLYIGRQGSFFNRFIDIKNDGRPIGPVLFYPAIYYENSKHFEENTALIQLRARHDLSTDTKFICISENSTNTVVSETSPESIHLVNKFCYFHTFIAACKTVTNPRSLKLTSLDAENRSISLPIELPIREKLEVVTCGSPSFFTERWQQAALAIEILNFYGVSRQVYYFMSSAAGFYDLLKAYEKLRIVDVVLWTVPDIPEIDSKKQLYMRDQMAAVNDCYQRYREAAEFIIVHDMDDLIFLPEGKKYYDEFKRIFQLNPDAAFIHYGSYTSSLKASRIGEKFDLEMVLKSVEVSGLKDVGKTVLDPKKTKSIWVHYPQFIPVSLKPYEVPAKDGLIIHMRNWEVYGEESYHTPYFKVAGVNKHYPKVTSLLNPEQIRNISESWDTHYEYFKSVGFITSLRSTDYYHRSIDGCVKIIGGDGYKIVGCRTVYSCIIEPVKNFECIQSRQQWQKHTLVEGKFDAYLPLGSPMLEKKMNGCTLE